MSHDGDAYDEVKSVPTPSEQERSCVRLVFELASKGWSARRIASHLNETDLSFEGIEQWGLPGP